MSMAGDPEEAQLRQWRAQVRKGAGERPLLPFQGGGQVGDRGRWLGEEPHPHPGPPLEREGASCCARASVFAQVSAANLIVRQQRCCGTLHYDAAVLHDVTAMRV